MALLLCALRLPSSERAYAEAARVTGLALADVRARLAGPLPRLLMAEGDDERARELAAALEGLGFGMLTCDARAVPGDDERLVARSLALGPQRLDVTDELGNDEELTAASLTLIQRGVRVATKTEKTKKSERRFSLGRALLTSGLLLTKKVETETARTTSTEDPFILLHRADGSRDVIIYERRVDYRFLGAEREPSSRANFQRLIERVRALAPRVPYDDRVSRPGLVTSLRSTSADPVDLALSLVHLMHLRGEAR